MRLGGAAPHGPPFVRRPQSSSGPLTRARKLRLLRLLKELAAHAPALVCDALQPVIILQILPLNTSLWLSASN